MQVQLISHKFLKVDKKVKEKVRSKQAWVKFIKSMIFNLSKKKRERDLKHLLRGKKCMKIFETFWQFSMIFSTYYFPRFDYWLYIIKWHAKYDKNKSLYLENHIKYLERFIFLFNSSNFSLTYYFVIITCYPDF